MNLSNLSKSDIVNQVCVQNTIDPSMFFEVLTESEPEIMMEMKAASGEKFADLVQQFINNNF